MGFDDFLTGLMDAALGGDDGKKPGSAPVPTATPVPGPVAPPVQQLPPEIVAALSGPFAPGQPSARPVPPKKTPPKKRTPGPQEYRIPPGTVAGPAVPDAVEVAPDVEPQYTLSSDMLPYELTHYQFSPGEGMRYVYVPDVKAWQPVPEDYFQALQGEGLVDAQGMPQEVERLPDLEEPTDEDIAKWQVALPEDMLSSIKTDAENDVSLYQTQLDQVYEQTGKPYDENGQPTDDQALSNKAQELETKLQNAKDEVSEYEALQYILYGIEPPKTKKEWVMDNIVSPIMSGVGKYLSISDIGRSQLGRRIGGYVLAHMASGNILESSLWSQALRANGLTNVLLQPLDVVLRGTDNEKIRETYDKDGSIGVWEQYIAGYPDQKKWPSLAEYAWHAFTDTAYDPLTYLPALGEVGVAMRATKGSNTVAPIIGRVLEPTIRGVDIATNVPGEVVGRIGTRTARAIKTGVSNTPYWKLGKTFAPSRGGEAKIMRQSMGASSEKLERAAEEFDNAIIGKPANPGQGGITPFPQPGTPPPTGGITPVPPAPVPGSPITPAPAPIPPAPQQVGGLTQQALTNPPAPRTTPTLGGPQVIGSPQTGPFGAKPPASARMPSMLERTVTAIEADPALTKQKLAKKLKVSVKDAEQLLADGHVARDTMRGPVQLYPTNTPGLKPHENGKRVLDWGYQSYLRGEEAGRRFIEDANPILEKYDTDPAYNSRLQSPDENQGGFGAVAWPQKAKAMELVADLAEVYSRYFGDLHHIDMLDTSYRGDYFGGTEGGLKNEFTQALIEELALGDLKASRVNDIVRILKKTSGHYVELTDKNGRKYTRSVGGLVDGDTGVLPAYAEDVVDSVLESRKRIEAAVSASKKLSSQKVKEAATTVDPADVARSAERVAEENKPVIDEVEAILDNSDDDRTADEVLQSLDEQDLSEPVHYPGDPSGGFNDVNTVVIVEDAPAGQEHTELLDTDNGQAVVIHKPKPSRATIARRKKAAQEIRDASRAVVMDDAEVERLAQQTAARAQSGVPGTPAINEPEPDLSLLDDVEGEVLRRDLADDPEIPTAKTQVMTPEQLVKWREENVAHTVMTGPRGEILNEIVKDQQDYLPSEGEFVDAMTGSKPDVSTPASTNTGLAQPRPASITPSDPNTLFPTQQELYSIGSEQSWRDRGLNIPDSTGKNPVSYQTFRTNVMPRPRTDLTNMDNKHVRYFRKYLARLNGLPKTAVIDGGNAFAPGYAAYEEATKTFWDSIVRYSRATRTMGFTPEDMGIEERGFFKRAPGRVSARPAKPELSEKQKSNLDLFNRLFDVEHYRFDEANIDLTDDVGVDSLATRGTNASRGSGQRWDFTPRGVFNKDISYGLETTRRFDPDVLGSDSLQDLSMALDVEDIDNAGKIIVQREVYDPSKDMLSDDTIGYASSLDEAKLMVLKDLYLLQLNATKPSTPFRAGLNDPLGIVGPSFHQMQTISDTLNSFSTAAKQANKDVPIEAIPAYAPNPRRSDVIDFGGKMGHLNSNEVKLWDTRLDLNLANEEFMDSAEKKLLAQIQTGKLIDPSKVAAMSQQQRELMIAMFGPAAGLKNPLTYPKRVKLTDKVMIDVLSRVDMSMLGKRSTQIYEKLGETAAQRSKMGNIYLAARRSGMHPREAEDFVLKLANLYTGPPGVIQNWDTAVRHAFMYNVVKAPFNFMQDTLNDALVGMVDGDVNAIPRWAKMFIENTKSNAAGSDAKILKRYKNADTPVLDEIHAFNKALGENIYPSVQSQRGGRYDDVAGRYVEEGKSWWETRGDSFGKWVDKTAFRGRAGTKFQTLGRTVGQVPAPSTVLRFRNMMDDMKRLGVDHTYAIKHYKDQLDDYIKKDLNRVAKKAGKAKGITMTGDDLMAILMGGTNNVFYGMPIFSPEDIRRLLTPYVGAGQSEHLARRWSSQVGALKEAASKQTDKLLYSYTPTNLDEQLSRIWMFHYWATRASSTHARLALENPYVMAAYYRAFEGTKRAAEEQGDLVPGWAKLFLPLQAGPFGMMGLVSPAAFLSGLSVVLDLQGISPNDFSWVDALQTLPMRPIVAAAMAASVSDRLPDPSGTAQTRRFVQMAMNFFRNTGIAPVDEGLTPDFTANAMYRIQAMSHHLLDPLPGVDPLANPSPEEKDTQDVKFYAINIMQQQGNFINPDTGEVTDDAASVLANIDAGIYSGAVENEALRQFSIDSMYGSIGKSFLFSSIYPSVEGRMRSIAREGRAKQTDAPIPDLAASPGTMLGAMPTFVDATPEITPEEEAAQLAVRLGDSGGKEATEMIAAMQAYKAIGTDDQRETYESMNDAIYEPGSVIKDKWGGDGIKIGDNRFFSWAEWDRMGTDERREWMDLWLQTTNLEGSIDEYTQKRQAYANAHPIIGGYLDWQQQINTLGPKVFLDRVLRDSPGFKLWWNNRKIAKSDVRRVLMTESAYLAAHGDKPSIYDPVGVEVSTSPNLENVMPPTSSESPDIGASWAAMAPEEKIAHLSDQERVYIVRLEQFNDKVMSLTGGRPYTSLAPVSKRDIDIQLNRMGLSAPEPGGQYGKYIQWAQGQPMGEDVSIEAYVRSGAS